MSKMSGNGSITSMMFLFYRALTDVSFDFPSGPPPWLSELYATLNQGGGENGKPKETPAN